MDIITSGQIASSGEAVLRKWKRKMRSVRASETGNARQHSHGLFSVVGLGLPTRLALAITIASLVWLMVLGVIRG